mmetsp:Transcript_33129/g.46257  ORF Transcript_33129/g.46257 Transcript_33129/m.46257 type:complete len:318 (+) Transcript_33129:206-1159(+)
MIVVVLQGKMDSKQRAIKSKDLEDAMRNIVMLIENAEKAQEDVTEFLEELMKLNILKSLIFHLHYFTKEGKQDVRGLWLKCIRNRKAKKTLWTHIRENPEILILLVRGASVKCYDSGEIFRACLTNSSAVHYLVLNSPLVWQYFKFVAQEDFELSSDAFKSFKTIVSRRKADKEKREITKFLKDNFDKFFKNFCDLLMSDVFHVKLQALKLLSEILQKRENFSVMVKFISYPSHLHLMIDNLCADDSREKGMKFQAFHVFKFFVANPKKGKTILNVLRARRTEILKTLIEMKRTEEQSEIEYGRELPLLIDRIRELE